MMIFGHYLDLWYGYAEPNAVVEHHDDHHGEEHDDHHAEEVALLSVAEVEHSSDVHHGEEGHADEAHGGTTLTITKTIMARLQRKLWCMVTITKKATVTATTITLKSLRLVMLV